ncbi:membrane-bound acylglycerophosphatidylinositol O-acyltransferase MBOAT7-like [Clavelina lepadiformis]|uniref:membrane-bound acylglycerophosphatidylinositol O-acyltransferase MBOAT7-like n=1 Tax=Clavelina lepadiformis TaxID=159417 RepID=UPI0040424DBD
MATSNKDAQFLIAMSISFTLAVFLHRFGHPKYKKEILSLFGLLLVILFCGYGTIQLLMMTTVTTCMIKSRKCSPRLAFVYCLAHRVIYCSSKYYDHITLGNAMMLVATIKMITVAYEINEYQRHKKELSSDQEDECNGGSKTPWLGLSSEPTVLDVFCYMTCLWGIFTGPIFTYKTYDDSMREQVPAVPFKNTALENFKKLALIVGLLLIASRFISTSALREDSFYEALFPIRLFHSALIALLFQLRFVGAWIFMETVYVLAGFGVYPVSTDPRPGKGPTRALTEDDGISLLHPTEEEYTFRTVSNIKPLQVLSNVSFRESFRCWNCCVQWWLSHFVYSSNIFPKQSKLIRGQATLLVSAMWHGVLPGYYVAFLPIPLVIFAENLCFCSLQSRLTSERGEKIYNMIHWLFLKIFIFAMTFSNFILLDYDSILRFNKSMYYYLISFPLFCIILCKTVDFILPHSD